MYVCVGEPRCLSLFFSVYPIVPAYKWSLFVSFRQYFFHSFLFLPLSPTKVIRIYAWISFPSMSSMRFVCYRRNGAAAAAVRSLLLFFVFFFFSTVARWKPTLWTNVAGTEALVLFSWSLAQGVFCVCYISVVFIPFRSLLFSLFFNNNNKKKPCMYCTCINKSVLVFFFSIKLFLFFSFLSIVLAIFFYLSNFIGSYRFLFINFNQILNLYASGSINFVC